MDFRLPELGEGVYEAELVAWLVKAGDVVKRGQNLMEVLTDKASMEVPAPFAGTITKLTPEPGQTVKVGDAVLTYTPVDQPESAAAATGNGRAERQRPEVAIQPAERAAAPVTQMAQARFAAGAVRPHVKAAPSVRYMARKLGVDLESIPGSGPGGRILVEDLSRHVKPAPDEKRHVVEPAVDYGTPGTRIRFVGIRRKIAERMVLSKQTIPHYTYVEECDVTELVRLREALRETYSQAGLKLTYLAFFVKAVVAGLKEVPIVNSSLDEKAGEILLHDRYHIGIAVSTPYGLIVPVIHDADQKDLTEIVRDIERLTVDARGGKSRIEDLRDATFTITSIGGIGGLWATPVINPPEVAILAIGKIVKRPVFDEAGNVRPADVVYLSLSCDHRVVDGAVGAAFANAVSRRLRNPAVLLLPAKLG